MGKIGFNKESEETLEQEFNDSFEKVKNFVRNEVTNVIELKEALTKELIEVDDLLNNLLALAHQVQEVKRMSEKRGLIYDELIKETNMRASEIDIAKCDLHIGLIREIDSNLSPMIGIIIDELKRLVVEETHILFRESEENKKVMNEIDKHSRELTNTVQKIRSQIASTIGELNDINSTMEELRFERAERDKKKLGF